MSIISGVVKSGVIIPDTPLPDGVRVEIHLNNMASDGVPAEIMPYSGSSPTPTELRRMPRERRQAILAKAAELAEQDYRCDKELTGFEAFSEEEMDDDESDSP